MCVYVCVHVCVHFLSGGDFQQCQEAAMSVRDRPELAWFHRDK